MTGFYERREEGGRGVDFSFSQFPVREKGGKGHFSDVTFYEFHFINV